MSEQEREVVPGIFINVNYTASSNLPWALAQARKIWVGTWIKDALEWLTTSVQYPPYEGLGTRPAPPLIQIH